MIAINFFKVMITQNKEILNLIKSIKKLNSKITANKIVRAKYPKLTLQVTY